MFRGMTHIKSVNLISSIAKEWNDSTEWLLHGIQLLVYIVQAANTATQTKFKPIYTNFAENDN